MKTVQSGDGTSIAFIQRGTGPSLVLVGGALSDLTAVTALLPHLEPHFTVYAYDRRGRGESGDPKLYEVDCEIEDIVALLDQVGEPVYLFGHSSGAVLALEAALHGLPVRRLVLSEPPFIVDEQRPRPSADLADRLQALVAANDREAALRMFLREAPGFPDTAIKQMQASPQWAAMLALAHTTPYDARITGQCILPRQRLAAFQTPTLVLQGGASPAWIRAGTEALAKALPHGQLAVLAGQGHSAAREAPELVASQLVRFLK